MIKMINGKDCFLDTDYYIDGEIVYYSLRDNEYYSKDENGKYYLKG